MLKKLLLRLFIGFTVGTFINTTIAIIASIIVNDGNYYAANPNIASTEISAVIIQFILSGILGAAFSAGSLIFESDSLSLLSQTILHFLVASLAMLPIAYFCNWMNHSILGFIQYFSIFVSIYFIIWLTQYITWKKRLAIINKKLKND